MGREAVSIRMEDGNCRAFIFTPDTASSPGQWPAVIFYLDGMGMRPAIYPMAQRIADMGYVVLLPDIFYRAGAYPPIDPAEVFGGKDAFAAIAHIFTTTDNMRAATDSAAFLACLDSREDVLGGRVGVTGYCLGGSIALTVAGLYPDRIAAAASFHGGNLATDDPKSPHRLAATMKADILVAAADKDVHFPIQMKARLDAALDNAGARYVSEIWKGMIHGWTMSDLPVYDPAGAEQHFDALDALFARSLALPTPLS